MSTMKDRSPLDLQLGRELRERRRNAGLSQTQVAAAVGVSVLDIGRWERGEALPSSQLVEQIGTVVRAPAADIVAWQAMAGSVPTGSARPLGVVPLPANPFGNAARPAPATGSLVPGLAPLPTALTRIRPAGRLAVEPAPPQAIEHGHVIGSDPGRRVYDADPRIARSPLRQWVRRAGTVAGLAFLGLVLWWALVELGARLGLGQ